MSIHRFETTERLPISLEEAWAFFSDPRNLAVLTPPSLGFDILGDPPESMYPGLMLHYRVRPLFRVPVTWLTEITHVREPKFFVDEQRVGPYRVWHHEHHFREVPGGVEMRDRVTYALPFGPLGALLDRLLVRGRVRRIFEFRRRVLAQRFARSTGTLEQAG